MKAMKKLSIFVVVLLLICGTVAALGNYTSNADGSVGLTVNSPEYLNFTVTADNRYKIGYTGAAGQNLNIPATFRDTDGKWYRVTSIGDSAFQNCTSLASVTIPNTVTYLGTASFYGCSNMTSVSIPNSVTSTGWNVFSYSGLTSLTIPGSIKNLGGTFADSCPNLSSITIQYGVQLIGQCAFQSNNSLTSITIPGSVHTIRFSAFDGCQYLSSISIPASVTSIEDWCFASCWRLGNVYYGGNQDQWNAITMGQGNDPLIYSTIHYGS